MFVVFFLSEEFSFPSRSVLFIRRSCGRASLRIVFLLCIVIFAFCFPTATFASTGGTSSTSASELRKEIELGQKVAAEIERHWNRIVDPSKIAYISMIAEKLIPHLERALPFEVRLIEDKTPNAFALPGGLVFVTTGMLDFVRSDHELAGILAHEFVHADRRHGMIQVARNERLNLLSLAVAIASKGQGAALLVVGLAQVAIMNNYSRDLEEEADREGLAVLFLSGYDPSGMVTVMERLSEEKLKRPYVDPGIFQSHPDVEDRVKYLIETMRNNGWKLRRKIPLGLLRPRWVHEKGRASLFLDQTLIWSVPEGSLSKKELNTLVEVLEENLQLELPPYEIHLLEEDGGSVLRIGFSLFLKEPLPGGADSLLQARERLLQSLRKARREHPLGNYLK
jgi:Zn-dependent protease with chaperone function